MSHGFVDRMLEQSKAGELRSPVSETLDMHLVEFGRGEAIYEMAAREELGNPLGVIQGGVATAPADAAMAAATTTILTDEEIQKSAITTIDRFARFIRPVTAKNVDRLRAEAKVVRAGGRLVWAEADGWWIRRPVTNTADAPRPPLPRCRPQRPPPPAGRRPRHSSPTPR